MIEALFSGVFGVIVGSFLNVLILRHQTGMTLGGRSQCFSCGKNLEWYELVPIISYVVLRGRCCGCRSSISVQYPIVEFLSGLLSFLIVLVHGLTPVTIIFLLASWLLLAMSVYDMMHMILPDSWTMLLGILGIVGQVSGLLPLINSGVQIDILAGFIFATPFLVLWKITKGRSMGFGDIKLMLAIGLFHGWALGLSSLLVAFWVGAVVSIFYLLFSRFGYKKVNMQSPIPFGPFLALGAVVSIIFPFTVFSLVI